VTRPYLVGWYYFYKKLFYDIKTLGFKVVLRRKNIYKQMLKKKYFWFTPEERVEKMKKGFDALKEMTKNISKETLDYIYDNKE